MTKNDFLRLQEEDIQDSDNSMLKQILECFKMHIPADAEISENKSVSGMYDYMYSYAKKNQTKGVCCIDPFDGFKKLAFEYLEIKESKTIDDFQVSLDDIFS